MKILHACLSNFYIDDFLYQENCLIRQNVKDGHEVLVIASTETLEKSGKLKYLKPSTYKGSDGAVVKRISYTSLLPKYLSRKLRIHPTFENEIYKFKPQVILFHGCCGYEILSVSKYKKNNPEVFLYVDSHEDFYNSARGIISRYILHKVIYKYFFLKALINVEKVLCVSTETIDFLKLLYGAPEEKLEFFPLGGFILPKNIRMQYRQSIRKSYGLETDNFVFLQSGKMNSRKKLVESLKEFSKLFDKKLKFIIVGSLVTSIRHEVYELIQKDKRIMFLGWKSPEELTKLLCATDVYLQPGTQSVTMQQALCTGCKVILDDVPAHQPYKNAGVILLNKSMPLSKAMQTVIKLNNAGNNKKILNFAKKNLDYKILANRILK